MAEVEDQGQINGAAAQPMEQFLVGGIPVRCLSDEELNRLLAKSLNRVQILEQSQQQLLKNIVQAMIDTARDNQLVAIFSYEAERRRKALLFVPKM